MKKTFYFILTTLFLTALFFSCQKDKSSSSKEQKVLSVTKDVRVDSLSKNDTGSFQRPITINATCATLKLIVSRNLGGNVIIGKFPKSKADPNVTLPRQEWVNGIYRLVNQADGNLLLYKGTPSEANLIWKSASNSTNGSTNRWFRLQTDLNMVEYDGNNPVWDAKTQSYACPNPTYPLQIPTDTMLILTSDGDLEIVANAIKVGSDTQPTSRAVLARSLTSGGQRSPNMGSLYLTYNMNVTNPGYVFDYVVYP